MPLSARPESVRVLCLDGGGIKGYTSLLILKRIFRTLRAEGNFDEVPRPSDIFDLIVGTSTGGLIAVMLGRLHMTIDECIAAYEELGGAVFGKRPRGGKLGKIIQSSMNSAYYDIKTLQEEVCKILDAKGILRDTAFREQGPTSCKVMLCVTRSKITKPDVLRNYESIHPTAENYNCTIWEAASATAAAPLFFDAVKFNKSGELWCDGGLRRNNPINEALAELTREVDWKDRKIGCVLSLGTGVKKSEPLSSSLSSVLKGAVAIMTDSDDVARVFASSELGVELFRTHRYFRFSVPQGMQDLKIDEWKEIERMRALTTDYLSHAENGDLLKRCAKSLLDPDENLHIGIKPKLSLMPNHVCTHFIERPVYSGALLKFFRSKTQLAQTFVLWGLGGVGKTQIALRFAQTVQHRFSVFWIRADRFSNFAADYTQLLEKLVPANEKGNQVTTSISIALDKTRRKLEEDPDNWLIILDNADDLDAFLGKPMSCDDEESYSISKFLPRHGRLLITTRDRRFQGRVGAANDGMKVDSLNVREATELLTGSIPEYLISKGSDTIEQAEQLVEELGYLPLAIAQAAANILDRQLTLSEYVSLYQDKKQRMNLMETPAHDFQTTDPRNALQSVNITWQISFDLLKDKFPQSAVFLTYIGCFYWRNIPRVLIQQLPEFRNLSDSDFIQLTKKPFSLSLLDEEETEPGFVEYMVHPLLHENILSRIPEEELCPYLENIVEVVWTMFPSVQERTDTGWNLAVYLFPHSARVVELCDDAELSSKQLSVLLLHLSQFSGLSNVFNFAVSFAERAKAMGNAEWSASPEMIVAFLANTGHQYRLASKEDEARLVAQEALVWLDTDIVKSSWDQKSIELRRINFQSDLAINLSGTDDAKREVIHRAQLDSGLVDEWSAQGIVIRHNLAHALMGQMKVDEAEAVNSALLKYAETDEGHKIVSRRLYLIMLNLRCRIIRTNQSSRKIWNGFIQKDPASPQSREEQLRIYKLVFKESYEQLGIEDADTWKATNNLIGCLSEFSMHSECGPILCQVLPAGIESKIRAEGGFARTLGELTENAKYYLSYIENVQTPTGTATVEFKKLLQRWIKSSGYSEGKLFDAIPNNRGVNFQQKGMFIEAELQHREAIDICLDANEQVPALYRYNLMLAIGRQGQIERAIAYREKYKVEVETLENSLGSLEERLERDRQDYMVYEEAQRLMHSGKLERGGEWWLAHEGELRRAELRYGVLKPYSIEQAEATGTRRQKRFRLGLRFQVARRITNPE